MNARDSSQQTTPEGPKHRRVLDGLRFVGRLSLGARPRGVHLRRTELAGLETKVFEPATATTHGTIIAIHGVAPSGFDDPRMVGLGRAFAAMGFRCLVPQIGAFTRCELDAQVLEDIRGAVRDSLQRRDLCPKGELSVFAACVSASLALVALSDARFAGRVRAVLALGAYSRIDDLLDHLLLGDDHLADRYGRTVLLYSWAHHASGPLDEEVREALWLELCDGHYGIARGRRGLAARYLDSRPDVRREIRVLNSRPFRDELARVLKREHASLLEQMSPEPHLQELRARQVVLIHGEQDPIIPSHQSERLHRKLNTDGRRRSELCVTPLIDHGDRQAIRPRQVGQAARLVHSFGRFFEVARADAPPLPSWSPVLAQVQATR